MKDIFLNISSFENLYRAFCKAKKCRRFRADILLFSSDLEENIFALQKELREKTYRHGGYREFVVTDSKKRRIQVAPFRDRVVHHALVSVIEPTFESVFITDSCACRRGRGTYFAGKRLRSFMRGVTLKYANPSFCLKCDISKYFDSVDHKILFYIIKKRIKDTRILWLICEVINSTKTKKGIPIGNLTSQLFANIYLNELDHFVKEKLHMRYYLRYMDDFLIFCVSKKYLSDIKARIREFLLNNLSLALHPKKATVFPLRVGIDFLGYVHHRHIVRVRRSTLKRIVKNFKKKCLSYKHGKLELEKFKSSFYSIDGFLKNANIFSIRKRMYCLYTKAVAE